MLSYSFLDLEPISYSIQGFNCCFLTLIQVSQETGKMVWYSHLSKNFPQFVMIYTVKGFIVVDETEIDVFLKFPCLLYNPVNVGNFISRSSSFSKPSLDIWRFLVCLMLKSSMQDFKHDWLFWPTAKYSMFLHELNWATSFPVTLHCLLTLCCSYKEPLTVSRTFHGLSSPWAFAYVVHSIWNALPHFWQHWLTHWVLEQM